MLISYHVLRTYVYDIIGAQESFQINVERN